MKEDIIPPIDVYKRQVVEIEKELDERVRYFKSEDKLLEAQRIAELSLIHIFLSSEWVRKPDASEYRPEGRASGQVGPRSTVPHGKAPPSPCEE